MAEKKVSVRLSATGGRQVRAELEGVGAAGSRGMGRLSRELDQANARMAAFARRAKIAATAAATALAGAVVAMTRSTVAAANEIGQLSQVANANPEVFQRWAAASATPQRSKIDSTVGSRRRTSRSNTVGDSHASRITRLT